LAELARHFLQGDDAERGLLYSVRAGDAAEALFAHTEAEGHYRGALELSRELPASQSPVAVPQILEKLGMTLRRAGRCDEAVDVLEEAAGAYRATDDEEGELRCVAEIGHAQRIRGTIDDGIARLEARLGGRLRGGSAVSPGLAQVSAALSRLYFAGGRYRESLATAERTAEMARALNDDALLAGAEIASGTVLGWFDHQAESLEALERGIALAERAGDLDILIRGLNNVVGHYQARGDFARAIATAQRALTLSEQFGTPGMIAFALAVHGDCVQLAGRWDEGLAEMERAIALVRATGRSWYMGTCLIHLANLRLLQGHEELALGYLDEARALAETTGDLQSIGSVEGNLAGLDEFHGRYEQALERIERMLATARGVGLDVGAGPSLLALVQIGLGREREAEETVRAGLKRAQAEENLPSRLFFRHAEIRLAGRQGRWEDAARAFEDALPLARDMPFPFAEGQLQYEYGEACRRAGDHGAAREHLQAALAIFRTLGAMPFAERTRAALQAVAAVRSY
jgi:tetratricopeptide (TPR) repeat protein